jgi:predicted metalloendopeptidase
MAKKNIGVRIEEEDFEQLQELAKKQRCTVTDIARSAIEQMLKEGAEKDRIADLERALSDFESRNAERIDVLKRTVAQIDTSAAEQALVKAVQQATRGIKFEVPEMPKLDTRKIDGTLRKLEEKAEQVQKTAFMRMLKIGAAVGAFGAVCYGVIFLVGWGAAEWKLSEVEELNADISRLETARAALERETRGLRIRAQNGEVFVALPDGLDLDSGAWIFKGDDRSYYKLK